MNIEEFWKSVSIGSDDDCWVWGGCVNGSGYGSVSIKGYPREAHRVSYVLANGDIPEGMDIDHLCRNRLCVNPKHLEAVTRSENLRRGVGFPAIHAKATHCPRGHPYDEKNTYIYPPTGGRYCRECNRLNQIERRARAKEAIQE